MKRVVVQLCKINIKINIFLFSKNSEILVKQSVKVINKMTIKEKIAAAEEAKKTPDKKKR